MIKRCTIEDVEAVNRIMRHPDIYPYSTDDGCSKDANTFDVRSTLQNPAVYFLGWRIDEAWAGLWTLHAWNVATYEIHPCILPPFRAGLAATHATEEAVNWMYDNTQCRKVVAVIPEINKAAILFALAGGMKQEGVIKDSFLKDGKLCNQILVGTEKGG